MCCWYIQLFITTFISDHYDALVSVGCFCEGHVKDDCFEELVRVVKPGEYTYSQIIEQSGKIQLVVTQIKLLPW